VEAAIIASLTVGSVIIGFVYSVLALGFNLVYRVNKSLNLAHPGLVLLAAYAALIISAQGLGLAAAVAAASLIGFAAGLVLERGAARPLLGRPPVALIAATLGIYYILRGITIKFAGDYWSGGAYSLPSITPRFGPVMLTSADVVALAASALLLLSIIAIHRFTKLGVAMRAVAENPYGAAGYGLPVRKLTALSWGIAGLVGALGGIALGAEAGVSPYLDSYVLKALAASLVAGLDSVAGIVVGGLILGFAEQFGSYAFSYYLPGFGDVVAYVVMLGVLALKPYGLFGTERIERI
jgi:branched-chain amino acid transport system permease protein